MKKWKNGLGIIKTLTLTEQNNIHLVRNYVLNIMAIIAMNNLVVTIIFSILFL
jgi:hypothetical protein